MRGPPKALLRVPDLGRGELRPTCPFDDLLIPSPIEMRLMMVVPRKVHVNGARTDQVFECAPDKPRALALGRRGAGGIMAEDQAPARQATERGLRGVQLVDPDPGLKQTGVHAVEVQPRWQEGNRVMDVREAPAVAVEGVI